MAGIHAIQKGERIVQLIVEGKVYDVGLTNEQFNALIKTLKSEGPYKYNEDEEKYVEEDIGSPVRNDDNFTHHSSYEDSSLPQEEKEQRVNSRRVQEMLRNENEKERIEFVRTLINAIKAAYFKLSFSGTTLSMTVPDFSVQDDKSKKLDIRVLSNGVGTITADLANKAMQEALVTLERVSNVITAVNLPYSIGTYPYQLVEGIANSMKYFINGDYINELFVDNQAGANELIKKAEQIIAVYCDDNDNISKDIIGTTDELGWGGIVDPTTTQLKSWTSSGTTDATKVRNNFDKSGEGPGIIFLRKLGREVLLNVNIFAIKNSQLFYNSDDFKTSYLFTVPVAFRPTHTVQTVSTIGQSGNDVAYVRVSRQGVVYFIHSNRGADKSGDNIIKKGERISFNINYYTKN